MKKALALMLAIALVFSATPGFANVLDKQDVVNNTKMEPAGSNWVTGEGRHDLFIKWASSDNYFAKATGMLHRGISNVAGGPFELFLQPYRYSKNSPIVIGQFYGLLAGITWATLRTASGALDLATFLVPWFYGVPLTKPVLGLHTVHEYEVIEDAVAYNESVTKRGFIFDKDSDSDYDSE